MGQAVDELEGLREAAGGLCFQVADQGREEFHGLRQGVGALGELVKAFVGGHGGGGFSLCLIMSDAYPSGLWARGRRTPARDPSVIGR